jgi:hypothetical protein
MVYFKALYYKSPEQREKRKFSVMIAGIPARIRIEDILNTS